jgi:hypothetical protein
VVAKVRERLSVNKQRSQRFDMERFNLKKLNEVEGKEQFHVQVSNRFAALEDLDAEVKINSAWETIGENIKMSAKESTGSSIGTGVYSASNRNECQKHKNNVSGE